MTKSVIFCFFIVFLAAVVMSFSYIKRRPADGLSPSLLNKSALVAPDWEYEDQEIATTPEMKRAVAEMLNFDEALFRIYRRNGRTVSLYVARWSPGRFHPRLISIHTPDVCWPGNGLAMVDANYNHSVNVGGVRLWHAQQRVFRHDKAETYVLYWHLINGRLSGYAEGPNSTTQNFFSSLFQDVFHGIGEQYFIRISSDASFADEDVGKLVEFLLKNFLPILREKV